MGLNSGSLDMVSISDFNKGKANKIFRDVRKCGTKLVVKHNKVECALVSPEVYEQIMEILEEYKASSLVTNRLNRLKNGKSKVLDEESAMKRLGINKEQIDKMDINLDDELEK